MPILPAGLAVDVVRAESARFRHPLLLLHGLWTGSWIWSGFAAYLAHRGWESWAPSFAGVADRRRQLMEVCRALPAPPVILAHDAGAVTAVKLAAEVAAPAIVAITPLLSRRDGGKPGVFSHPQFWSARLLAGVVKPPRVTRLACCSTGWPTMQAVCVRIPGRSFDRCSQGPIVFPTLHLGQAFSSAAQPIRSCRRLRGSVWPDGSTGRSIFTAPQDVSRSGRPGGICSPTAFIVGWCGRSARICSFWTTRSPARSEGSLSSSESAEESEPGE